MSADESPPLIVRALVLGSLLLEAGEQKLHAIGHVRPLADPVFDAIDVQTQLHFGAASHRIEQTNAFEAGTTLALAAVGHHHVIKRRLLATASSQSDRH